MVEKVDEEIGNKKCLGKWGHNNEFVYLRHGSLALSELVTDDLCWIGELCDRQIRLARIQR